MTNQEIISCAFCKGEGKNPHFSSTCPVCKGRGKNEVVGKYMTCSSCRGSGQKKGTTLTCYDCGGIGVLPDTRETFRRAREEIGEAQKDLARERPARHRLSPQATANGEELTEKRVLKREDGEDEPEEKTHFCQCCASEVNESIQIKICHVCFGKMKEIA